MTSLCITCSRTGNSCPIYLPKQPTLLCVEYRTLAMNKTTEPITIGRLGLAHEEVRGLIKKTKATLTRIRLNRRFRLTTPGIKYVYTIQFLLSALEEELDEVLKQRVGELDKAYRLKPVDQDKTD